MRSMVLEKPAYIEREGKYLGFRPDGVLETNANLATTGDLIVAAGQSIYVDGGVDTGIRLNFDNSLEIFAGSVPVARFSPTALSLIDGGVQLAIQAGVQKLIFDANFGSNDYIWASADGVVDVVVGGAPGLSLTTTLATIGANLRLKLGENAAVSAATPSTHKIACKDGAGNDFFFLVTT